MDDGIFAGEIEEFRKEVEPLIRASQASVAILVAARSRVIVSFGPLGGPQSLNDLALRFVREAQLDEIIKGVQERGVATNDAPEGRSRARFELLQRRMIVGMGGQNGGLFQLRVRQIDGLLERLLATLEEKARAAGGVTVPFEEMKAEDVRAAFL